MKTKVIVCNCLIGVPEIEFKNVRCYNDKAEHFSSFTQYMPSLLQTNIPAAKNFIRLFRGRHLFKS